MMRIAGLLLLAWPLSAQPAAAVGDCEGVLAATLASGSEHPRLEACAGEVIPELETAIHGAALETDAAKLTLLHRLSMFIRDPTLYESGLALGRSPAAEPAARVLGLSVALAQANPGVAFQSTGADRPFQEPLSEICAETTFYDPDGFFWVDRGVADEAEARLRAVADAFAENSAESLMVRRFARCVVLVLPDTAPPSYEVPDWPPG
jgi:hypothetical protein